MVPSERTVTVAVGHGKLAARNIDGWLRGTRYQARPDPPMVDFAMLHLPMFSDADPGAQRDSRRPTAPTASPRSSPA